MLVNDGRLIKSTLPSFAMFHMSSASILCCTGLLHWNGSWRSIELTSCSAECITSSSSVLCKLS